MEDTLKLWNDAKDRMVTRLNTAATNARTPEDQAHYTHLAKRTTEVLEARNTAFVKFCAENPGTEFGHHEKVVQNFLLQERAALSRAEPEVQSIMNAMSYELREPWWEAWLKLVYDKDKAAKENSTLAGLKPAGIVAGLVGMVGLPAAFGLELGSMGGIAVGVLGVLAAAYGAEKIADLVNAPAPPAPTPGATPQPAASTTPTQAVAQSQSAAPINSTAYSSESYMPGQTPTRPNQIPTIPTLGAGTGGNDIGLLGGPNSAQPIPLLGNGYANGYSGGFFPATNMGYGGVSGIPNFGGAQMMNYGYSPVPNYGGAPVFGQTGITSPNVPVQILEPGFQPSFPGSTRPPLPSSHPGAPVIAPPTTRRR